MFKPYRRIITVKIFSQIIIRFYTICDIHYIKNVYAVTDTNMKYILNVYSDNIVTNNVVHAIYISARNESSQQ